MAKRPQGIAEQYSLKEFNGSIRPVERVQVIAVGAQQILGADPERMSLVIVNHDPAIIYVGLSKDVSASRGIPVTANGGYLSFSIGQDGDVLINPFYIFSVAGGGNVYTLVGRRETLPAVE